MPVITKAPHFRFVMPHQDNVTVFQTSLVASAIGVCRASLGFLDVDRVFAILMVRKGMLDLEIAFAQQEKKRYSKRRRKKRTELGREGDDEGTKGGRKGRRGQLADK